MRTLEFCCESDYSSVKYFLKNIIRLSTSLIIKLKQTEGIFVNDVPVTVISPLRFGDILRLVIPYSDNTNIESTDAVLDILYEDEDVICINKPHGIPTHPSHGHHGDTLMNAALFHLRKTKDEFHVVTRLDRYTSGIVLAAKNQFSASIMSTAQYNKQIVKRYIGECRGIFDSKSGVIEHPIARCSDSVIKRCVSSDGKYAKTSYDVLAEKYGNSLVQFELHTGRTHQIRVHTSFIGHPLVNDFLYDSHAQENQKHKLHCGYIKFIHPYSSKLISVEAKLPQYFESVAD